MPSLTASSPVVLYVVQPSNAIVPTFEMKWGGSHRLSYWHLQALARCGLDLHVIVPRGSRLKLPDAEVIVASIEGVLTMSADDEQDARQRWRAEVVEQVARLDPDVVLLQGPDVEMLRSLPAEVLKRVVFCSHFHFDSKPERRQWLEDHPEVRITAVSEIHRANMGALAERAVTTRAGIPVEAYNFRAKPVAPSSPALSAVAEAFQKSGGKLVCQLDRFARDKSQLSTVSAYVNSSLPAKGWQLVMGGNEFVNGRPSWISESDSRVAYHAQFEQLANHPGVLVLGPLTGVEVEAIYGASSLVMAPYGIELNDYKEAFGIAPAIAQAVGTPVFAADSLDPSHIDPGLSGWWMQRQLPLHEQLDALEPQLRSVDRSAVRRWAETHQDLRSMFRGYGKLIQEAAEARGKRWTLSEETLEAGYAAAVTAARP